MVTASQHLMVGVSDMEESLRLFRDVMQLQVEADYSASGSLLAAWGLPEGTSARLVELSCKGYSFGRLRLAAFDPVPTQKVRIHSGEGPHDGPADIGCKAIDFYVSAPIRPKYEAIVECGYEARSEPVLHEVGDTISEEFVFFGPDGVPLLYMVGHKHDLDQLRPGSPDGPFSEVATVSVVGADIAATRAFYEGVLGLNLIIDQESTPEFLESVNKLTGTPKGTAIRWLLYGAAGEASGKILVVHFTGADTVRLTGRMRPGHLGFSVLSHHTDDIDGLYQRMVEGGYEIVTKPVEVEMAGTQQRLMLVKGPNEEMFEFVGS